MSDFGIAMCSYDKIITWIGLKLYCGVIYAYAVYDKSHIGSKATYTHVNGHALFHLHGLRRTVRIGKQVEIYGSTVNRTSDPSLSKMAPRTIGPRWQLSICG